MSPIPNLQDFLEGDRQWPREHRISHALMQRRLSKTAEMKKFWSDVLKANQRFANERPYVWKDAWAQTEQPRVDVRA